MCWCTAHQRCLQYWWLHLYVMEMNSAAVCISFSILQLWFWFLVISVRDLTLPSCCFPLIRWLSMTTSGQEKSPRPTLWCPAVMIPCGRERRYQRTRPAHTWWSTPCTRVGWNRDTDTSYDSQMEPSLRFEVHKLHIICSQSIFLIHLHMNWSYSCTCSNSNFLLI